MLILAIILFGMVAGAARIESSKVFAKRVMRVAAAHEQLTGAVQQHQLEDQRDPEYRGERLDRGT